MDGRHESFTNQGHYEVIQTLGNGQSGQTLLARPMALGPTSSSLVIKQIYHPHESLDTLTQCLKVLGQHPQLPSLIDSWQTSDGQFLAFEYIDAPTITRAEPIPWSPGQVKTLLLSILPVLEYLHSFRLIHGDIRPTNICQRQLDPSPQLILIDLRITRRLNKQISALTAIGGDAAYSAPEQALGTLVYASDLYSLGLVAIHLLTGLSPFELYSVADNRWIWADLVTVSLPKKLHAVLQKLLERSLSNRYTRADQVLTDLKKSSISTFINKSLVTKAYSLLSFQSSLPKSLQVLTPNALAPTPRSTPSIPPALQLHWQPLYQFTTGLTTALALQANTLAMGTSDGRILLCDLTAGSDLYPLSRRHRDRITALAFHPQVPTLYSASQDGTIKRWDLTGGKLLQTLSQRGWKPTDLVVTHSELIVSDATGHITLWALDQLKPHHRFNQHQDWVNAIATNGQRLASISRDRTLRLWCLSEQRLLETRPIQPSQALVLHPSGDYVIIGNQQGQIDVWPWPIGTSSSPVRLCHDNDAIVMLALSPDARLLAAGTDGNALRIYQGTNGQCVSELAQGWGGVAIAFDGHTLVSSSQDETVTIWQRKTLSGNKR